MMHSTRLIALRALFLTLGLLAVFVSPVFAGKAVLVRSKPQVLVGTLHGEAVQFQFHANARVFDDVKASGTVQLRVLDGESFLYRVTGGRAVMEGSRVVEVVLVLARVGRHGTPTGETDLVIVRPSSTIDDCLIYDIVGPIVHLEAQGHLGLPHLIRH